MDGLVPLIHFGFDHTSSVFSILNGRAPSIPAADDNLQIIGVHGVGFVADQVVIDSSDVSSVFLKTRSPRQIGEDIRGSLTLYLQDSSRHRAWILPDLLGMGIVFMWSQADKWAVSSSLPGLISFLQSNGVRITKDADYVALSAATGNGGLVSSPYEEIKAVPPFSYLEAFGPEIKIQEYSNKTELLSPVGHEHYREALSGLAEEIMQNVALLADVDAPHHVCHLTGGLDSRTVLAALLATGRAGRFVYHTGGDKKHQDFIVASQLSAELGLVRCDDVLGQFLGGLLENVCYDETEEVQCSVQG